MNIQHEAGVLNTSFLEEAAAITKRADLRPGRVRHRLLRIGIVLGVSMAMVIVAFVLIATNTPQSEPARLVTTFLLAAGVIVVCASIVGMGIVLSTAAVYLYVQNLAATRENYELTDLTAEIVRAVTEIGVDPLFEKELAKIYADIALGAAKSVHESREAAYRPVYDAIHSYFGRRVPFVGSELLIAGHAEQPELPARRPA